ncbi:hypothetical protein VTL71DRAFT_15076 [Oculimacula yallundae]|uniref:N-acetyltransferase domain-containing protein n=1 Tax=Oculimacula yallundae TaxID=86028 RepID=A0ABR4CHS0_9HELO
MLFNEKTAISTPKILLVPYEASHVLKYHEWMQDEKIQAETASEPLTLEEEYSMQKSWRTDVDKLTFIACLPLDATTDSILDSPYVASPATPPGEYRRALTAGTADSPSRMIGDVNLFLTHDGATKLSPFIGEIELMIAPTQFRRNGHGRGAVLAFLTYIARHLDSILLEYWRKLPPNTYQIPPLRGLRVKIGIENEGSLRLFRSLGFECKEGEEEPDYFGELELWFQGTFGEDAMEKLRSKWRSEQYEELLYWKGDNPTGAKE